MFWKLESLLLAALALAGFASAQDSLEVRYKGAGWVQFGRIMHSTDSLVNGGAANNMNGNWVEDAGASIGSAAKFGSNWEGAMGMGAVQKTNARGDIGVANNWYPFWVTFLSEARLTYSTSPSESQQLQVNLGYFNYNYNPEVKDLGVYLLRGYVYPGAPISGFEAKHTTGSANIFGAMGSYTFGAFKNDLLFISETDNRPYFDGSIADIVTWQVNPSLQIGAGVNFYRSLPRIKANTSPGKDCKNEVSGYAQIDPSDDELCYELDTLSVDTVAGTAEIDTILGSMAGTKLMGRFRWDPKNTFGLESSFGKQDFVLYGEVAVLGLKNYNKYYRDIKRRIPVMVGMNLPAFGYLDKFSLEVEYYASKNMADYGKSEASYSWVPRVASGVNNARDDWKWALYFSRVVMGHLRLSGQVANDHLRMFGPPDIGLVSYGELLTTPKDWYWMFKTTYFF